MGKFTFASLTALALAQGSLAQLSSSAITALLDSLAPAADDDPRFTNWTAPGAGDVRSPCPGLNTLANHGFIPHNGKGMTIPVLLVGLAEGMNIGADFTIAIGAAGLLSSPDPLGGSFDLDDLDQHNFPIEHDASLSRQDAYFGNDYSFYAPYFNDVLSYYAGDNYTSITQASLAKYSRVNQSMTIDPDFTYGLREFVLSYGETGLYLQSMSDPVSGVANVDYIKTLFEEEKLPYELGWRPSTLPITLVSLGAMLLELYTANPEAVPEGVTLVEDSYKDIFEIIVGGSEILANLTDGLSTAVGL